MTTRYVYTLSSDDDPIATMPEYATHSIRTLTRWVDPERVVVFFTPPRREEDVERLRALGVDVREVPQVTERFRITATHAPSAYGEKVHLCEVDADTVVFLDCDTLVLGDVRETLGGDDADFDFKARRSPLTPPAEEWASFFAENERPPLDYLPNTGFLVFRNGTHAAIRDDWLDALDADPPEAFEGQVDVREQWALALAVSERDCAEMTPREHVIEWEEPVRPDGVVHHLDTSKMVPMADVMEAGDPVLEEVDD